MNVYKTFRRRPGGLNVLCAFNLRPVATGYILTITIGQILTGTAM